MDKTLIWLILVIGLLAGGSIGAIFSPVKETVNVEIPIEIPGPIEYIEVPGEATIEQVEVKVPSESFWVDRAWDQILDEFDNDENFLTCGEHEFDDDELSTDLEKASIFWNEDGDYRVSLDYQFEWEDNSDERDCKIDHKFVVSWDDDDVEDEDWDEAKIKMLY